MSSEESSHSSTVERTINPSVRTSQSDRRGSTRVQQQRDRVVQVQNSSPVFDAQNVLAISTYRCTVRPVPAGPGISAAAVLRLPVVDDPDIGERIIVGPWRKFWKAIKDFEKIKDLRNVAELPR